MKYFRHTDTKKWFIIYLNFKYNWHPLFSLATQPLSGLDNEVTDPGPLHGMPMPSHRGGLCSDLYES